jgi:hypothetical protein
MKFPEDVPQLGRGQQISRGDLPAQQAGEQESRAPAGPRIADGNGTRDFCGLLTLETNKTKRSSQLDFQHEVADEEGSDNRVPGAAM